MTLDRLGLGQRLHEDVRDVALLRRYAAEGSEAAFTQLVERYLPLVYSAALRQVGGDRSAAEDVAQHVFIELARCAGKLSPQVIVPGWLYRATRFTAAKVVRAEQRRRAREATAARDQELQHMNRPPEDDSQHWDSLCSHLDEAMNELDEGDRNAILLRFFQFGFFLLTHIAHFREFGFDFVSGRFVVDGFL